MVSMITLEIVMAVEDFEEGQFTIKMKLAQMFSVFGGIGIMTFGIVVVMWPKSVSIYLDRQKDRFVVEYTHMFNKIW